MEKIGNTTGMCPFRCQPLPRQAVEGYRRALLIVSMHGGGREVISEGNEQYINDRLLTPYRFRYRTHYQVGMNETMRMLMTRSLIMSFHVCLMIVRCSLTLLLKGKRDERKFYTDRHREP